MHPLTIAKRTIGVWVVGLLFPILAASADTEVMIREAISAHDQQDYGEAIRILSEVLELEPDNGEAAYELAFSHQANGDLKACSDIAGRALIVLQDVPEPNVPLQALYMMQA
jgi:Flp pilus assembly protein TadD